MKPDSPVPSARSLPQLMSRILAGAADIREGEGRAVLASGTMFFLLLAVVMVLRPVREAIALERGIENIRVLFFGTAAVIVLLVPAFGYLVSGVFVYGLLGWLVDRWWETSFMVVVGILAGAGLGIYMTFARFNRPWAAKAPAERPVPPPDRSAGQQDKN